MKPILSITIVGAFFLSIIFVPAGTLDWPNAWAFIVLQLSCTAAIGLWLMKHNKDLLKERTTLGRPGVKGWDKVVQFFFIVFCSLFFTVAAFDVIRYRWSEPLPFWMNLIGFLGVALIMSVVFLVMRENTFLARVVRIQKDRGQKVVTTGPYSIVRHPMYSAFLWYLPSISLALGSQYSLLIAIPFDAVLIVRTYLEDRTLKKELPGYADYAKKTRYRLLPGVW